MSPGRAGWTCRSRDPISRNGPMGICSKRGGSELIYMSTLRSFGTKELFGSNGGNGQTIHGMGAR